MATEIKLNSLINTDAKDFNGLVQAFFEYAQNKFPEVWSDFNSDQFMVLLAELIAYMGDLLTYYADRQTTENFITLAKLRQSIIDLAKFLGYRLSSAVPSSGEVTLTLDSSTFDYGTPIPVGFRVGNGELVYETVNETLVSSGAGSVTVGVIEGETARETTLGDGPVSESDGTPNQKFMLEFKNIILSNIISKLLTDLVVSVGGTQYRPTFNIGTAQSTDKVFTFETDDKDQTTLVFGNGQFGIIPPTGATIEATYRYLLPDRIDNSFGNVNAGSITTLVDTRTGITAVTNGSAFTGGRDKESIEEARVNAPASVKAGDRAVSQSDHVTLAILVEGVAKAAALNNINNVRNVDLYIAPDGGGLPSQVLKNQVVAFFEQRRMMRTKVFVRDPIYQPISLNLRIQAEANNRNADIQEAVKQALEALFDFDNMDFGRGVFLKTTGGNDVYDLNDAIESVDGIAKVMYNKVTLKPVVYNKKFTNSGLAEFVGTGSRVSKGAYRREFEVEVKSSSEYLLKSKEFGISTSLNDTRLEDNLKNWLLTSGSSTYVASAVLNDESQFWEEDQFAGQTLIDSAGTAFEIASNDDISLTLISGTPAAGAYQIVKRLVGYILKPDVNETSTFEILSNDANSVSVDSGLSAVSVIGNHYEIYRYETNLYHASAFEGSATSATTATGFQDSTATGFANDHFNDMYVIFQEGPAANIPVKVTDFVQVGGTFTIQTLGIDHVPDIGDRYIVAPAYRLGLETEVASSPSPTTTVFSGDALGGEGNDFYNEYTVYFAGGALAGQARKVIDFDDGAGDTLTTNAFPTPPTVGDTFQLTKEYQTDDQTITFGIVGLNSGLTDVYLFQSSYLVGDLVPKENQILQLSEDDLVLTVIGGS